MTVSEAFEFLFAAAGIGLALGLFAAVVSSRS